MSYTYFVVSHFTVSVHSSSSVWNINISLLHFFSCLIQAHCPSISSDISNIFLNYHPPLPSYFLLHTSRYLYHYANHILLVALDWTKWNCHNLVDVGLQKWWLILYHQAIKKFLGWVLLINHCLLLPCSEWAPTSVCLPEWMGTLQTTTEISRMLLRLSYALNSSQLCPLFTPVGWMHG